MAFLMGGLLPVLRLWVTLPVILWYCRDGFDLRCPSPEGEVEIRDGESLK